MSHRVQSILAQLAPQQPCPSHLLTHVTAAAAPVSPPAAVIATADLCDDHADKIGVLPFQFRNFGQLRSCHGPVATVKVYEDNGLVRAALEKPGEGRVLIVDGGASTRCALVGDQLGLLAVKNGWAGIVVVGCVRDSAALAGMPVCVQALGTNPSKSVRRGGGAAGVPLALGLTGPGEVGLVYEGCYAYADEDGVLITKQRLHK